MRSIQRSLPILAAALASLGALSAAAQTGAKSRTFRFTCKTLVRDIPAGTRSLDLWIPYPQTNADQTIHQVRIEAPGAVTVGRESAHGNEAAYCHVDRPGGPVEVTMEVLATRREDTPDQAVPTPAEAKSYLAAEPLVPLDGPVKAVAEAAVRGRKGDAARADGKQHEGVARTFTFADVGSSR